MTNISSFQYSYCQTIGNALETPLFLIATDIGKTLAHQGVSSCIYTIAKLALDFFLVLAFVVPTGVCYLLGKTIKCFAQTQVDYNQLHKAPPKIEIPDDVDISIIDLTKNIMDRFKKLGLSSSDTLAMYKILNGISSHGKLFQAELSYYLNGIYEKTQAPDSNLDKDKEKAMWGEIAKSASVCHATWFQAAKGQFLKLENKEEKTEDKLLRKIQHYKEDLILQYAQNTLETEWHLLSYMSKVFGDEFGLNTNPHDEHVDENATGRCVAKWLFLQLYDDPNQIVEAIQTSINLDDFDSSYKDFLVDIVTEQGIPEAEDYVANSFFDEDYQITFEGVNCLLKHIGILR